MSTVVFTLEGGLSEAYHFKCNQCLIVEIYLSHVSLVNFLLTLIINCVFATEYCAGCSIHSCLNSLPCTRLQFRGMGQTWLANEGICLVKTCHVVITYLSPKCLKGIGKMEKKTFYPKTRIQTIMDKSPWDTNAISIFFCHFWVALKNRALFLKFSCSSPSLHPIQS